MHRTTLTAEQLRGLTRRWSPPVVRAVSAFYLYTLGWLLLWVVIPSVVMWSPPVLITSGSMEPGIRAGDVVVVGASDGLRLDPGTVVTFRDQAFEDRLITHRITTATDDGSYVTKGDANPGPDSTPLAPDGVEGVPQVLVSTVGVPLLWVEQGRYALVAAWLIVTLAAASHVLKRPRRKDGGDRIERDPPRDVPRPSAASRVPRAGKAAVTIAVLALVSLTAGRAAATLADATSNGGNSFDATEWEALVAVDGGEVFSCGVNDEGAVWCWGSNDRGQLGDGTEDDHTVPVQVVGSGGVGMLSGAVGIGAGSKHTCVVKTDGTVWCWGLNDRGQLGDGTNDDHSVPVQVKGSGGTGTLTTVTEITAGLQHSCAVKTDGTAWCWGLNDKGQLGDNTTTDSSTPVQVKGPGGTGTLTTVTEITAGLQHSCAVKTDGTAWCWGLNNKGQLGDNTTTDSSTPVQVKGPGGTGTLTTIILIGSGNNHTCAAKQTHTIWCWGLNDNGQLGNNTTTNSPTPVQAIGT